MNISKHYVANQPGFIGGTVCFTGSRRLNGQAWKDAYDFAKQFRLGEVVVGDAKGLDEAVRKACKRCRVCRVQKPMNKSSFVKRSIAMIDSVENSYLFAFPDKKCPNGIYPSQSWKSGKPASGTWSTFAYSIGQGNQLAYVKCQNYENLPAWKGEWVASHRFSGFYHFFANEQNNQQSLF